MTLEQALEVARNEACELLDALLAGRCGSGPVAMKRQVADLRKVGQ